MQPRERKKNPENLYHSGALVGKEGSLFAEVGGSSGEISYLSWKKKKITTISLSRERGRGLPTRGKALSSCVEEKERREDALEKGQMEGRRRTLSDPLENPDAIGPNNSFSEKERARW